MKQTSGIDALLEALKQSGVNMGGFGGVGSDSSAGSGAAGGVDSSSDAGSGAGSRGGSRGGGHGGSRPHIDVSFMDNIKAPQSKGAMIALIVVAVIVLAALYWWFHPPINIHSVDTWLFVAIFILLPLFLFFTNKSRSYKNGSTRTAKTAGKAKTFKMLSLIPVVIALLGVLGGVLSLAIIPGNAEKYSNVLQTDTLEFAEDIQEVNYSEIPVIDRDTAERLGNKEMGTIPEYVSQFEVSSLYSQINYQGSPVRVSPLGYADLFKWFTNREAGIPAYALVNMTTQDAEIVRLGDSPIHYSQSEPLVRNIDRHVQLSYPFYMFDEKSFEIDEEGHPWWICPVKEFTIGLFGGTTISRVVLVDATTGECQDLAVEDCPEWVDRVYPAELLIQQYNWYGSYLNGWLNSFLGQEGVVRTTPGTDGQAGYNYIAKDDDVWVYTGVTSATSDQSIIGFVLINQRTQESHFYSVSGATEESAMSSAEGQVQNLRYTATFPILINVADQPTYFMALKDGEGLVKKFAMVEARSYQNVAVGDTVADCQKTYEALLATNGVVSEGDGGSVADLMTAQGVIRSMAQAVIEGNSHFYVTLEGDSAIYDFALPSLIEIVGYREGDSVEFTYVESTVTNPANEIIDASGQTAAQDAQQAQQGSDAGADAGVGSDVSGSDAGGNSGQPTSTQSA